jgi:hypothetical protein
MEFMIYDINRGWRHSVLSPELANLLSPELDAT